MDNEEEIISEEEINENEEPIEEPQRRETWAETESRLRTERARQRYLENHPFHKDRVEIKPMKAVIELASNYFASNEKSDEFELEKAVLGSKLGIGSTKTLSVCNALSGEYDFITDSRGFIAIDRKGFQNWLKLTEELENEKERNLNQQKESQVLIREADRYKRANEENDRTLAETRSTRDKLKAKAEELTKEKENLPNEIKELNEKISRERASLDQAKKESSNLNAEISKAEKERREIEAENRQKMADLQTYQQTSERRKNLTPLELLNEENVKLRERSEKLLANIEDRKRRVWVDTVEGLKASILFLFKFFFPFVVSYYLWHYLESYEWYWFVGSLMVFWIVYLWLVFRDW